MIRLRNQILRHRLAIPFLVVAGLLCFSHTCNVSQSCPLPTGMYARRVGMPLGLDAVLGEHFLFCNGGGSLFFRDETITSLRYVATRDLLLCGSPRPGHLCKPSI